MNAPYAHLQSGLTADEMQTFAEYLGFSPPTAFEKLYMWRDGQSAKYFEPLFANFSYEPTQQARESHRVLTQLLDAAEFELPNWWRRE